MHRNFGSFVFLFSAVFSRDLIFLSIIIFLTSSYEFFNTYFNRPPHLCVSCYDRHIEKGNPGSRFLKSKYKNKLNVTFLCIALARFDCSGSLPQNIDLAPFCNPDCNEKRKYQERLEVEQVVGSVA